MAEPSYEHVLIAAQGADEARALDIAILDVRALTSICDYFVICHGRSAAHVQAVAEKIEETMHDRRVARHHREGGAQANWIVLDYIDVVVHVFNEETRRFYDLERLWGDAPRVVFAPQLAVQSE